LRILGVGQLKYPKYLSFCGNLFFEFFFSIIIFLFALFANTQA